MAIRRFLGKIKRMLIRILNKFYIIFCTIHIRLSGIKYVLLLAPLHDNIGDHAIALAEQQYFRERGKDLLEINIKRFDNNEKLLARLVPKNTTIIVHGGGFLGALWPREEYRIRRVFESFKKNKIVVFPQTVTFYDKTEEDKAFFEESKRVYSSNKNITIFVRDQRSFNFMKDNMPEVNVKIVPDIVTILKAENREKIERKGIVFCFRRDLEKNLSDDMKAEIAECVAKKYPDCEIVHTDTVEKYHINRAERHREVNKKLELFASSKLVITDRLHGMVMSAITNTPCIAFGNINGKVKGVYSWIKNNDFVRYVDTTEQFKEALDSLDLNQKYEYSIDRKLFAELDAIIGGSDDK